MAKEKHLCDNCGKDVDELLTRQGFQMTHFVEWVCYDCFVELEGVSFEQYGEKEFYVEARAE